MKVDKALTDIHFQSGRLSYMVIKRRLSRAVLLDVANELERDAKALREAAQ